MSNYYRPLVRLGSTQPDGARQLAGGWGWFSEVEVLARDAAPYIAHADDVPEACITRLTAPRPVIAGLDLTSPKIMGILNVTPDSFSDGGWHEGAQAAVAHARQMREDGADVIDIGGESTRPGALEVPADVELARIAPAIAALRAEGGYTLSLDTRKAAVAQAVDVDLINDVSGFTHDPDLAAVAASQGLPVCLMHTQGTPDTMQSDPSYRDVVLDVYDWLEARLVALDALGIPRDQIIVDPGIGFGKTQDHNLSLLRNIAVFHGLGAPILLGVSRKGFIGRIGNAPDPMQRAPGSVAVGIAALAQGVQILRVHDVREHQQAIALWRACVA